MIVSHKHKFIFIHIPKTGGTSINDILNQFLDSKDPKPSNVNTDPLFEHTTAKKLKEFLGEKIWNSYFKFAIVRNPWDKIVSQYHYFKQTEAMDKAVPNWHENFNKKYKNFKDWLVKINKEDKKYNWWNNNLEWITDENGNLLVDFIGKTENINEDFNKICEKIGLPKINLPNANKSKHEHYSDYYDEETKKIIEDKFKKDIELFDYKFENQNNPEKISVITACKNRQEFLEKTLPNWLEHPEINEIIIVDWDSEKPLDNLVYKYQNKKIILIRVENQSRWILSKAYNLAIKFATNENILKLDSDILISKDFFKYHHSPKGVFYTGSWKLARNENEHHLNGTLFINKNDFLDVNGYNENIKSYGWEDSDLYIRLVKNNNQRKIFNLNKLKHIPHKNVLRIKHQPEIKNHKEEIRKNQKISEFRPWTKNSYNSEFEIKKINDFKYVAIEKNKKIEENIQTKPKVSIITSVYKGNKYIEPFLKDITRQTIFNECELIIINPNSPENEEPTIREYMKIYPNIIYKKLDFDPGLYECWNIAIKMSKGEYITNANVDDRRSPLHIKKHIEVLDNEPFIDAVSAPLLVTFKINETWERNSSKKIWFKNFPEYFYKEDLFKKEIINKKEKIISQNILHCMPVWRKTLHDKNGYFDENKFGACADWEFWLRCASNGSGFKLLKQPLGLYLLDPKSHNRIHNKESSDKKVIDAYFSNEKTSFPTNSNSLLEIRKLLNQIKYQVS